MKIQGVAGGRHPNLKKGDAIPLTSEKKLEACARESFIESSPEGWRYIVLSSEVQGDVQIITGRGNAGDSYEDSNQYRGNVLLTYKKLDIVRDRLFPGGETTVLVHCADTVDDIGVPDLKAIEYKVLK